MRLITLILLLIPSWRLVCKSPQTTAGYLQTLGLEHTRQRLEDVMVKRGPAKVIDLPQQALLQVVETDHVHDILPQFFREAEVLAHADPA